MLNSADCASVKDGENVSFENIIIKTTEMLKC